jgi:hypothetical protein
MTVARISLTQRGYISEAVNRFSSVFKKQLYERVCKEQSYEFLRSSLRKESEEVNSRSKFSARVSKCEDVKCVII